MQRERCRLPGGHFFERDMVLLSFFAADFGDAFDAFAAVSASARVGTRLLTATTLTARKVRRIFMDRG